MKGELNKDFYCTRYKNPMESCGEKYLCMGLEGRICSCRHRKWPTPEQFKEEYGEEWGGPVYMWVKTMLEYSHWEVMGGANGWRNPDNKPVVCICTPWGKPPDD